MNVIIIDDEKHAIETLTYAIEKANLDINIIETYTSVEEALVGIPKHNPDLLFLDVQLGEHNSFDLLDNLNHQYDVIFVTAYTDFAFRAFKYSTIDFIEKPANPIKIISAINKINDRLKSLDKLTVLKGHFNRKKLDKIVLNTGSEFYITSPNEIIYLEADEAYSFCYLSNNSKIHVNTSLKEFDDFLSKKMFYRIHKSFIINLNHIVKVQYKELFNVEMTNNDVLTVARKRKKEFRDLITDLI